MGKITESHVVIAVVTTVTANVGGETNMPAISILRRRESKLI